MQNRELSYSEWRPHHVSLTHFCRRNWLHNPDIVQNILSRCVVSPYLGALPPELRGCVAPDKIAGVTYEFRMRLDKFLMDNISDIRDCVDAMDYDLSMIGDLFGLSCHVEFAETNYAGCRKWSGAYGTVGKIAFLEINATYALKVFYEDNDGDYKIHGPLYEIPTAFAATHAEPRDNSRVYMASLGAVPYMLSRWEGGDESDFDERDYYKAYLAGKTIDSFIRKNKNKIFIMPEGEASPRNYRDGRRIDYGETFRTVYGEASYRVRKMYRKIMNATTHKDTDVLDQMAQYAASAAPAAAKEYREAMDLVIEHKYLSGR